MSWLIEDAGHGAAQESVFAIGNGYLGVRGAPEEGAPAYDAGTVLNGFYESWPIVYPEDAYGLARTGQTIVAPPDGSIVRLLVDGEPLDVTTARVTRKLDMRAGGCFCETWDGGSAEHGRVILVLRDRLLRLEGALGPLQERAVTGILGFLITREGDRTKILVTYRVRAAEGAIESTAEGVDRVIGEQVERLTALINRK